MVTQVSSRTTTRRNFIQSTCIAASGLLILPVSIGRSTNENSTITLILNPTPYNFTNELVRLKTPLPDLNDSFQVTCDGVEIGYQIEKIDGQQFIWICADFPSGSKRQFKVFGGKPKAFAKKVNLRCEGGYYIIENPNISLKIPEKGTSGSIPGPIAGLRLDNNQLVCSSFWKTKSKLKRYSISVVGDGTLFAKLRLRYDFEGKAGPNLETNAFAEIDIMLAPDWHHASLFERHNMEKDDFWELILSDRWLPCKGISRQFNNGPGGDSNFKVPPMDRDLLPLSNISFAPDLYINLIPRWNQHFKDGWAFAASDGEKSISVVAVKASQWIWPHDNGLKCVVKPEGNYAGVRCSTWHGQRLWWLAPSLRPVSIDYVAHNAWESIDKINHDYILEDSKSSKWWSTNPYDSEQTNPTHSIRRIGKEALKNAGQPADENTLIRFQTLIHKDCWGSYWNFFSPENPNFFTDYNLVPIALATNLKNHPQFETFRKLAENKFREDLYHSVTLPGGAGQECPGYSHYGMSLWREIAEMGEKHLGFDMEFINERLKASENFYQRISYPDRGVRRGSPMGDSHPDRKGNTGMPKVGVDEDVVKSWKTEELPGFGVIFSNLPGTQRETYLSFKSGPNRCHYHGDQLAYHYCANGSPLVVDHHCSYHPRAGQEHMHNRMAFFTNEMPFANMDGYERLIAFKTSGIADIAIGQVESPRLRAVAPLPPEAWDARYPQLQFSSPLIYRRTVVLVKNNDMEDYFVFRDQYWADRPLKAAYCLHTYGEIAVQKGSVIDFDKLTLYCNHSEFIMKNFAWRHENGGIEETNGVRLEIEGETGDMITVLYPGKNPPEIKNVASGVQVGDDVIVFKGNSSGDNFSKEVVTIYRSGKKYLSLPGNEIDLNRSQGEIGLFVPDAGYPFGDIPDWLIRQRTIKPKWAEGL